VHYGVNKPILSKPASINPSDKTGYLATELPSWGKRKKFVVTRKIRSYTLKIRPEAGCT